MKKNLNSPDQNSLGSAQGELPQREERLRKNLFWIFIWTDLSFGVDNTERRKTGRKKKNVPN
jgi:predicted branched-subunit amino acid permease